MEPLTLTFKTNYSYSFRRNKSFAYSISHEESNLVSTARLKEESTNPTPYLKSEFAYNKNEISPNTPHRLKVMLMQQPSNISKTYSVFDQSPARTEILGNLSSRTSNLLVSSYNLSPVSKRNPLPKHISFSRLAEGYANESQSSSADKYEFPQISARSGLCAKENSLEISEIIEESSHTDNNLVRDPHIFSNNQDPHKSYSPNSVNSSYEESILIERVSSASSPISGRDYVKDPDKPEMRGSLPLVLKENKENIFALSFEEAFIQFKAIGLEYFNHGLWLKTFADYMCCIVAENLDEDSNELCEKLIVFAYSGFKQIDLFHNRLLVSVHKVLSYRVSSLSWSEIGFSSNSPFEGDLKHDVASLGLFQLLFLDRYLNEALSESLRYCLENNMAFILIAFDISEICITILRKKKLNRLITQSGKAIEAIFFLYAGCLLYWITLHKTHQKRPGEINSIVEKLAMKNPEILVELAREEWGEGNLE